MVGARAAVRRLGHLTVSCDPRVGEKYDNAPYPPGAPLPNPPVQTGLILTDVGR